MAAAKKAQGDKADEQFAKANQARSRPRRMSVAFTKADAMMVRKLAKGCVHKTFCRAVAQASRGDHHGMVRAH